MLIAVITDQIFLAGGIERVLSHKVKQWIDCGYEVVIITHGRRGQTRIYDFPAEMREVELNVEYLAAAPLHSWRNVKIAFAHFRRLRQAIRRLQPDVIIHCVYGFDYYFVPLLSPKRALLVKEHHSSVSMMNKGRLSYIKKVARRIFERCYDRHVFLSDEEAVTSRISRAMVIPNMLPVRELGALRSEVRHRSVISAGRICSVKGFDRLLRAWAIASSDLEGWILEIYGDGHEDYVAELHRLIASLDIQNSVSVFRATPDITKKIAEARVYALASRSECFPMVILEAMAVGTPVVAFDCPTGPRNIIKSDYSGVLVPNGSVQEFARALVKLATDDDFSGKISRSALQEVRKYEEDVITRKWDNLFHAELLTKRYGRNA